MIADKRELRSKLIASLDKIVEQNPADGYDAAQCLLEETQVDDTFFISDAEKIGGYLAIAESHYLSNTNGTVIGERVNNLLGVYQKLMDLKSERDIPADYEHQRIEALKARLKPKQPNIFMKVVKAVGNYATLRIFSSKKSKIDKAGSF